jgi:hypothetical protein
MSHKFLALCALIMVFPASLGCLQESLEPYIGEVDQNDQSLPAPVEIGQMFVGKRLVNAKLKGANLRGSMMAGVDLREADLEDADLTGAMLLGTHLENAQINGANFKNISWFTQDQIDDACGTPRGLPEGLKAPEKC